jgi:hypothetical protein
MHVKGGTCRMRELPNATDAIACAQHCLEAPFCAASTFFGDEYPSLRHRCFGRTAGPKAHFSKAFVNVSTKPCKWGCKARPMDHGMVSAYKHCSFPSCNLQDRLDQICLGIAARQNPGSPCRRAAVARNRRAVKQFSGAEAYGWICTAAVNPNVANETALACVDDRGYMVPCAFEGSAGGVCGLSAADERELTDGHRRGCAPASCISLPGASPPTRRMGSSHADRTVDESHAAHFATGPGLSAAPLLARVPTWRKQDNQKRLDMLRSRGYATCVSEIDEGKGKCSTKQPTDRWLQWAWVANKNSRKAQDTTINVSARAEDLSWWVSRDEGDLQEDPFDAHTFIDKVVRMSNLTGRPPEVHVVGDSTSRQQAVSLCCLLSAGAHNSNFSVATALTSDTGDRKMGFRCSVQRHERDAVTLQERRVTVVEVIFTRIYRGDGPLSAANTLEPMPAMGLLRAVSAAPPVLLVSFGAWDYQEGCDDRQAPTLCDGSRTWLMHAYSQKWKAVSAALNRAYPHGSPQRRHALVMVRTNAPRSSKCKDHSSRDCWGASATCSRTEPAADPTGDEGNLERYDLAHPKKGTMRLAVLSQNAIILATVWQQLPWVRVLDAYAISRLRVDAHPGDGDCLHYCLPGVPDVWNGRLLRTLLAPRTTGLASESLTRWNFIHPIFGEPFVEGKPPNLLLNLHANTSHTRLECATTDGGERKPQVGECSELESLHATYVNCTGCSSHADEQTERSYEQ